VEIGLQFGRFVMVGSIAASVDLIGYHWLNGQCPRLGRVLCSIVSTTAAMAVSFVLNRHWVFSENGAEASAVIRFIAVTLVAAYGIQSAVIYVLSCAARLRRAMGWTITSVLRVLGIATDQALSGDITSARFRVIERNAVKAAGLGAALVWNFCWYRWYVFA
jgi:putative flippase GtrA